MIASRCLLVVLVAVLIWSGRNLYEYGHLYGMLQGKSVLQRGVIGCDRIRNFLVSAGRPQLRRQIEQRRAAGQTVDEALGGLWAWMMSVRKKLPVDARIYLNVPREAIYFYGTTIWFPRRIDVNTGRSGIIRNVETLVEQHERVDRGGVQRLRRLGCTHVCDVRDGKRTLLSLDRWAEGSAP